MRIGRIAVVSGASVLLAVGVAMPGGAQKTQETTVTYAAESTSAGAELAITPPDAAEPAAAIFGAATESSVNSDPFAEGKADALAVAGTSPVTAETEAPPDGDPASAESPIPAVAIPMVGTVALLQGTASSESEAEDGSPSTTNAGTFGAASIAVDALPVLPGLGAVSASVNVAQTSTSSEAGAPKETNVSAGAQADGVVISADLDIELLQQVCSQIPVPQLQTACNTLTSEGELLNVTVGPSQVECSWDGTEAACAGDAHTATISLAGVTQTVDPGETVTIPDADPFLARVRAGNCDQQVEGNEGSAICSGISVELLGTNRANPGLLTFAIGQCTAGVAGEVETRDIIARTGGPLLPLFLGGSVLVLAGYGLRRYLQRP